MTFSSLLIELLSVLGSVASLVSLALVMRPANIPLTAGEAVGFAIAGGLLILFAVVRLREYFKLKPKACRTPEDIKEYMYRWISKGGRVGIFSRDMSWVDNAKMNELLRQKARGHELILCLPRAIPLSDQLASYGAEVFVYPELDMVPSARFTIINLGRHDAQVAIGRRIKDVHTIQEASAGHDPLFAVADDLINVISRLGKMR